MDKQEEKNLTSSIKLFNIGIRNNPEDDRAYYGKAAELIKLERKEKASECLNKAIKID